MLSMWHYYVQTAAWPQPALRSLYINNGNVMQTAAVYIRGSSLFGHKAVFSALKAWSNNTSVMDQHHSIFPTQIIFFCRRGKFTARPCMQSTTLFWTFVVSLSLCSQWVRMYRQRILLLSMQVETNANNCINRTMLREGATVGCNELL